MEIGSYYDTYKYKSEFVQKHEQNRYLKNQSTETEQKSDIIKRLTQRKKVLVYIPIGYLA